MNLLKKSLLMLLILLSSGRTGYYVAMSPILPSPPFFLLVYFLGHIFDVDATRNSMNIAFLYRFSVTIITIVVFLMKSCACCIIAHPTMSNLRYSTNHDSTCCSSYIRFNNAALKVFYGFCLMKFSSSILSVWDFCVSQFLGFPVVTLPIYNTVLAYSLLFIYVFAQLLELVLLHLSITVNFSVFQMIEKLH